MLCYLSCREVSLTVVEEENDDDDACTLHASSTSPTSISIFSLHTSSYISVAIFQ